MTAFGTRLGTHLGTRLGTKYPADGASYVETGYLLDDVVGYGGSLPNYACWIGGCLRDAYDGPLFRVRRDGVSAGEQDIGRDATFPMLYDADALSTFCAGVNGFVRWVYDQSGNARHFGNSSASAQPKIWDSVTGLQTRETAAGTEPVMLTEHAVLAKLTRTGHGFSGAPAITVATNYADERPTNVASTIFSIGPSYGNGLALTLSDSAGGTFLDANYNTWHAATARSGLNSQIVRIPAGGTRSTIELETTGAVREIQAVSGSDAATLNLSSGAAATWGQETTGATSYLIAWPQRLTGSSLEALRTFSAAHSVEHTHDFFLEGQSNASNISIMLLTNAASTLPANFSLRQNAYPGTSLIDWEPGSVHYIRQRDHILLMPADRKVVIAWLQGEAESGISSLANGYGAKFLSNWNQLEADTGRQLYLVDVLLRSIPTAYREVVNDQKLTVVGPALGARYISIDPDDAGGSYTDGTHYDLTKQTGLLPLLYAAAGTF